jgi:CheY-like chemotaxis protein
MSRTILLADDSPTIRRVVTQTFADANFQIVEVNNGDAAIKTFEQVRPSVVLADIYMPGKNGYQVCTYVRNHQTLGQTPVILLVGAFDAFDEDAAKHAGATASITKPFEPGALIELVTSVLPAKPAESEPESEHQTAPVPIPAQETLSEPPLVEVVAEAPAVETPAQAAPVQAAPVQAAPVQAAPVPEEAEDLLGLTAIFGEEPKLAIGSISDQDIDLIAERVMRRVSSQVIESIAWDVVPDITEKIVREELKRINESGNP